MIERAANPSIAWAGGEAIAVREGARTWCVRPRDIVAAVREGVDTFDCVLPTRNGRNAYAFTASGPIRLRNSKYARDTRAIEPGCDCYACQHFTRGAIRHYFFAAEMLGPVLVSVHNIRFYQRFMADVRRAIAEGRFDEFCHGDPRCSLGPTGSEEGSRSQGSGFSQEVADPVPGALNPES